MILSSRSLDTVDTCDRKYALLRDYEPTFVSPMELLYAGVESGIVERNPGSAAKDEVRQLAATKDVQSSAISAFSATRHIGLLAEVVSIALRSRLGSLERVGDVSFGSHTWSSGLFRSGAILHKIVLIPHYDDDVLRYFAHQWGVVGELVALRRDILLTAVVVGQNRNGRRHSSWTKGLGHPQQKSVLRFARRNGDKSGFTKGWQDVWREQTQITAESWLSSMQSDGVLEDLLLTRRVPYRPQDARVVSAERDLVQIVPRMEQASAESPMRRSACDDLRGACPLQPYCWSLEPVEMEELEHLFVPKALSDQTHREETESKK